MSRNTYPGSGIEASSGGTDIPDPLAEQERIDKRAALHKQFQDAVINEIYANPDMPNIPLGETDGKGWELFEVASDMFDEKFKSSSVSDVQRLATEGDRLEGAIEDFIYDLQIEMQRRENNRQLG